MFKELENIETAFKKMRFFLVVLIIALVCFAGWIAYLAFNYTKDAQNRIYILANSKAIEAISADRKENIPVEAKDAIKTFHAYFFNLEPDESQQKESIGKALYLADNSAKRAFDDLTESGYFRNITSSNISQSITVDSISLNLNSYPYHFKFYGRQTLVRTTSTTVRSLITEGFLRNIQRSENNPHGFLIERWETIENEDLKVDLR